MLVLGTIQVKWNYSAKYVASGGQDGRIVVNLIGPKVEEVFCLEEQTKKVKEI